MSVRMEHAAVTGATPTTSFSGCLRKKTDTIGFLRARLVRVENGTGTAFMALMEQSVGNSFFVFFACTYLESDTIKGLKCVQILCKNSIYQEAEMYTNI